MSCGVLIDVCLWPAINYIHVIVPPMQQSSEAAIAKETCAQTLVTRGQGSEALGYYKVRQMYAHTRHGEIYTRFKRIDAQCTVGAPWRHRGCVQVRSPSRFALFVGLGK